MNNLINNRNEAFYGAGRQMGQKTMVDYENNFIEKRIIASKGDMLVRITNEHEIALFS